MIDDSIEFREAKLNDLDLAAQCLRDVYESCYVDKNVFDGEYLKSAQDSGRLSMYVAVINDNEVIGTLATCELLYFPNAALFYLFTVKKDYQRRGVSHGLNSIVVSSIKKNNMKCVYANAVTHHKFSQVSAEKIGFIPTGFLFSFYSKDKTAKIKGIKTEIQTLTIHTKAIATMDVGEIYIPQKLMQYTSKCYEALGAKYKISDEDYQEDIEDTSELEYYNDNNCKRLYICIKKCGKDLKKCICEINNNFRTDLMQTRNIYLSINDKSAIYGYNVLKEMGYIFAGLKPLGGEREYMILFDGSEVFYDFSNIILSKSSVEIFKEVMYEINEC